MPDDASAAPAAPAAPASAPAAPAPAAPAPPSAPPVEPSIIHEPTTPAPAEQPSLVNPDGTFIPEWATKLPDEEFGDFKSKLAVYKSPIEVAKALRHANLLIQRKGVVPPTPESSPEQVAEYRKAMGVPETPKAYAEEVKPKVEVPPNVRWDDQIADQYFQLAHKHNIPAAAMKEMVQLNLKQREFEGKQHANQLAEHKQAATMQLRQHWGANFDRNLDIAKRAASRYGISPNDAGWSSPEMVKAWVRAMNDMGEDKLVAAGTSLPAGTADLRSRARDIQTNPQNPNYQKYWNGDADVQAMVRDYLKKSGG